MACAAKLSAAGPSAGSANIGKSPTAGWPGSAEWSKANSDHLLGNWLKSTTCAYMGRPSAQPINKRTR